MLEVGGLLTLVLLLIAGTYIYLSYQSGYYSKKDIDEWSELRNWGARVECEIRDNKKKVTQEGEDMSKSLYIGNLSYDVSSEDLKDEFAKVGEVESARVILDRETGRSRGFGFVNYLESDVGEKAITDMDGSSLYGRNINVKAANERAVRPSR